MYIQSVFKANLFVVQSDTLLQNQIKDVSALVSLIYNGYGGNGNTVKRIITKRVQSIPINGLKQKGLLKFQVIRLSLCFTLNFLLLISFRMGFPSKSFLRKP